MVTGTVNDVLLEQTEVATRTLRGLIDLYNLPGVDSDVSPTELERQSTEAVGRASSIQLQAATKAVSSLMRTLVLSALRSGQELEAFDRLAEQPAWQVNLDSDVSAIVHRLARSLSNEVQGR